jgi:hypothetical protein
LQKNTEQAIDNLQKAMKIVPGKYEKLAKTDPDFAKVRNTQQFQETVSSEQLGVRQRMELGNGWS